MANLQDLFLNQARKERINVSIYLTNGFQHRGIVKGFDNFVFLHFFLIGYRSEFF